MRIVLKCLLVLVAFALITGAGLAASFTASLDRDALVLGESATLSLTFEGGQSRNVPTPVVPGLRFTQNGSSQNFSIVNGAMNSTVTVNFLVTPQRDGEFTIPALYAEVNGRQLSTSPLKLVVSKASAPSAEAVSSGNEVAFLKLSIPRQNAYVGECFVARLDLYLRDDVQELRGFQLVGSATDGFAAGKPAEQPNQRRRVQVGGRAYTVIPVAVPLTVLKSGGLTLGPLTANVTLELPSENRQMNDPLRQFGFRSMFSEARQITLASESLNVESRPLPEQGRPANFSGAIGQFDLAASAGPTTVTVGDPITVRVQVSGRGSFDSLTLPPQDAWSNFKAYPPTTKLETSDQFGFQGTKTFEQVISPLNTDIHELPALSFSYFNPDDGQYHTLTQPAVPLVVKAAGSSPLPPMAANNSPREDRPAQDILPIKDRPGPLTPAGAPLIENPVFIAAQGVPVLAFLSALVWRRRADKIANNPRLRRQRAVAALVAAGKADLKRLANENRADDFFAALFRLLQEQLGERLDCPASAITENVVDSHALLRNAPAALRAALREQFQLCNQARYAPVRGAAELNSVAAQFEKLLAELQNLKS